MTNHNKATYSNGYDADGKLPYFDSTTDMGEDQSTYCKEYVLITAPAKDPPVLPSAPE